MPNLNVLAKRMRYVVPFRFDPEQPSVTYRESILMLNDKIDEYGGGKWIQVSARSGEQDVYEYILDSFDENGYSLESNIGATFRYKADEGILPEFTYHINSSDKEEKVVDFKISEIGMFLFAPV